MSTPDKSRKRPDAANDNEPEGLKALVLIPSDLPIMSCEIEVFALLLDDLTGANDNEEP